LNIEGLKFHKFKIYKEIISRTLSIFIIQLTHDKLNLPNKIKFITHHGEK